MSEQTMYITMESSQILKNTFLLFLFLKQFMQNWEEDYNVSATF